MCYKSEDGVLHVKLVEKITKKTALELKFEDQGMRIRPKQTQIMMFDLYTIALRFSLDSKFLNPSHLPDPFVNFSLVYDGPKTVETLTCRVCKNRLLQPNVYRVKSAPSDHWQEAAGLW